MSIQILRKEYKLYIVPHLQISCKVFLYFEVTHNLLLSLNDEDCECSNTELLNSTEFFDYSVN